MSGQFEKSGSYQQQQLLTLALLIDSKMQNKKFFQTSLRICLHQNNINDIETGTPYWWIDSKGTLNPNSILKLKSHEIYPLLGAAQVQLLDMLFPGN